jgi:DNA (cytosine-5)-methyltransferase 1
MRHKITLNDKKTKWKFYSYLNDPKVSLKGDIRSFIGLQTWTIEFQNQSQYSRNDHYDALNDSVKLLSKIKSRDEFDKKFTKMLKFWLKEGEGINRRSYNKPLVNPPVKEIKKWKINGYNLVSLFSGAFGLDLGFIANGFEPLLALDNNPASCDTIQKNLPKLLFINKKIETQKTKSILNKIGVDQGGIDVLTGGPPCQPFSTAGRRASLQDPRASPLREYIRFIKEAQPKIFVMEEVKGILSARIRHVPIIERKKKHILSPDELPGSAFLKVNKLVNALGKYGYKISCNNVLNAADFGTPQIRDRLIIIGCKDKHPIFPVATHSNINEDEKFLPWTTFWDATCDLQNKEMEFPNLPKKIAHLMEKVPPGGYWKHLPKPLLKGAMGEAFYATGGKMGFFRRLSWDTPTPTVTTSPHRLSSMLCHPEELRPLSVEECKRVQGFPDDWEIPGSTTAKFNLIGNAVPVYLSNAIAKSTLKILE